VSSRSAEDQHRHAERGGDADPGAEQLVPPDLPPPLLDVAEACHALAANPRLSGAPAFFDPRQQRNG
jgi:hypothetical protein